MRASNARPYDVTVSADKDCTHGQREFYGFARSFDTVFTQ